MNSQELRNLQEAYMEVYASPEQKGEFELWVDSLLEEGYNLSDYTWDEMYEFYLDESSRRDEFTRAAIARNAGSRGGVTYEPGPDWDQFANRGQGAYLSRKQKEKKRRKELARRERNEQVDIYDIILSHLLDEGYAETPEAAEVIMVNMSEEWRDDIVNEGLANLVGKVSAGVKDVKDRFTGKKELLGGKHGYIKVGSPSKPGDRRVSGIGPVGTYSRSSASNTSNRGPARTMFMTADGNPR